MRKSVFLTGAAAVLTAGLWSGAARANMEDIVACTNISDDAARLACYDNAVPGVREELEEQNAALEAERDQRSFFGLPSLSVPDFLRRERETSEDEFGAVSMETREAREEGRTTEYEEEQGIISSITAEVVEWGRNPRGKYFVVLDNGHVWRQTDEGRVPLRNNRTNTVTIRRGALGSFFLRVDGVPAEYRFERIR